MGRNFFLKLFFIIFGFCEFWMGNHKDFAYR
jgi:hypothetical protein